MKKILCVLLTAAVWLSALSAVASATTPTDVVDGISVEYGVLPDVTHNGEITQAEEVETIVFSDTKGHWAEEYISESVRLGLFKGTGEDTFSPDAYITRAQFITVLWRMSGAPETEAETSFSDISEQSSEFKSAISWGKDKGYISGTSADRFSPDDSLTREAAMKILFYYAGGLRGDEIFFTRIYDEAFVDSDKVSSWAKPSVYWGIYNKLIRGISKTELNPQGVVTRAQLAKILVDYNDLPVEG